VQERDVGGRRESRDHRAQTLTPARYARPSVIRARLHGHAPGRNRTSARGLGTLCSDPLSYGGAKESQGGEREPGWVEETWKCCFPLWRRVLACSAVSEPAALSTELRGLRKRQRSAAIARAWTQGGMSSTSAGLRLENARPRLAKQRARAPSAPRQRFWSSGRGRSRKASQAAR
jgi:hypothetical protein